MCVDQNMFEERSLRIWVEEGAEGAREESEDGWECEKFFEGPHLALLMFVVWYCGELSR